MSDFFTSNSMIMLERAANFNWVKQQAILDNIANAETPNYKVKYVTFEEALRAQIRNAVRGTDTEAKTGSMRAVLTAARPSVHVADDESARMDEKRRQRFRAVHGAGAERLSGPARLPGHQQRHVPAHAGHPRAVRQATGSVIGGARDKGEQLWDFSVR